MTDTADMDKTQLLQALAEAQARIARLEADLTLQRTMGMDGNGISSQSGQGGLEFRHVIDASPVPCALNDDRQNIIYLNPAFVRTFGYDLKDIPTLSEWWPKAYPDADYRQWVAHAWAVRLDEARRTGAEFSPLELRIICKHGAHKTAMVAAAPLSDTLNGIHLVTLYDITELKQAEQRLQETASLLDNVINSTPDLIFVKNRDLQVILCNEACASAAGMTREAMYGRTDIENGWDPELVHGNPDKGIHGFSHDDTAALAGEHVRNPYDPANVRGEIRVFDTHKLPLRDANDDIIGVLGIARDITERRQAERELNNYRQHLENMVAERTSALAAANRELESFSYSVSHDLRAPLRAIDGFSLALLEDHAGRLDDDGRDCLRRIRLNAQRMGRLIDDLLSLARVTGCRLERQDVNLSEITRAIVGKLHGDEPARDIETRIAPDVYGWADPRMLEIVLDNLVGNAWKYTGRTERPRIEFDAFRQDGRLVYRLRDNGVGFDMQYVGKLFGAFQRLHKDDEFEGTGIGLATVSRIITRHGGRVWAEGEVGQGAAFYFTLGDKGRDN